MARQQETGCQTRKKSQIPANAEKKQAGSFNFLYKEKNVSIDSTKHIGLLKNTIQHLQALKSAYAVGSARRHIISQTCSRLNRLVKKLESQPKA